MRNNNPKENNRQPFRPFLPQVPKIIFENFARKDNEPWAHYEFRVRCLFGNLFLETFFGNQVSKTELETRFPKQSPWQVFVVCLGYDIFGHPKKNISGCLGWISFPSGIQRCFFYFISIQNNFIFIILSIWSRETRKAVENFYLTLIRYSLESIHYQRAQEGGFCRGGVY